MKEILCQMQIKVKGERERNGGEKDERYRENEILYKVYMDYTAPRKLKFFLAIAKNRVYINIDERFYAHMYGRFMH